LWLLGVQARSQKWMERNKRVVDNAAALKDWQPDEGWDFDPEVDWKPDLEKCDVDLRKKITKTFEKNAQKSKTKTQSPSAMKSLSKIDAKFIYIVKVDEQAATDNTNKALENISSLFELPDTIAPVTFERDDAYFKKKPNSIATYDNKKKSLAVNPNYLESSLGRGGIYHEFAHYIWDAATLNPSELSELLKEIEGTNAFKRATLEDKQKGQKYWSLEEEVWARALAQYICESAGDEKALYWLTKANIQWEKAEFAPLKNIIAEVLGRIGITIR
jgi:hypothetical protein